MTHTSVAMCVAALVLTGCVPKKAIPNAARSAANLDGFLAYKCGVAVPYATVTLRGANNAYVSMLTDPAGKFQFTKLPHPHTGISYSGQFAQASRTIAKQDPSTWRATTFRAVTATVPPMKTLPIHVNRDDSQQIAQQLEGATTSCNPTKNGSLRGTINHVRSPWDNDAFSINAVGCGKVVALAAAIDGSFGFDQLPAGHYQVVVMSEAREFTAVSNDVEIQPNQITTLQQTLRWWPVDD